MRFCSISEVLMPTVESFFSFDTGFFSFLDVATFRCHGDLSGLRNALHLRVSELLLGSHKVSGS